MNQDDKFGVVCLLISFFKKMEEKRKWTKFDFVAVKENKDVLYIHEGLISQDYC